MTTTKPSIKIFEAYFKPWDILETDIITPIHCGKAESEYDLPMIGDDTGDNISHKNFMYNELTAQYWAWKNDCDYDYIGFIHYRRHFNFGKDVITDYDIYKQVPGAVINTLGSDLSKVYHSHYIDEEYINNLNFDNIPAIISPYDILVPTPEFSPKNIRDNFISDNTYAIADLKILKKIIRQNHREYLECFDKFFDGDKASLFNMFIMKKDLFNEYADFLFDVLLKFEEQTKLDERITNIARTCGYMGDFLLNIFIMYHKDNIKIKYLQRTFINNSLTINYNYNELIQDSSNAISIALCFNLNYLPHNYILIKSIMAHANNNDQYNIYCLIRDMQYDCSQNSVDFNIIETFQTLEKEYPNLKVIFIDVSAYKKTMFKLPSNAHYSIDTFTRLFIPDLLVNISKIIYLDGDIIVCDNIKELFDYDLTNLAAGVSYETMMQLYVHHNLPLSKSKNIKEYISNEVTDPFKYFNAGVLLLNLDYIRRNNIQNKWYDLLSTLHLFVDQDILNITLKGLIKWIDPKWNVWAGADAVSLEASNFKNHLRYKDYKYWLKASQNPSILHYVGNKKPYNTHQPYNKLALPWWNVAKTTPFYEHFLMQIIMDKQKEKTLTLDNLKRYLLTKHPKFAKCIKPFYWGARNIYWHIKSFRKGK